MGDLKPLGSERLQGTDKLKRIMEIARFNESIPQRINETSKNEYNATLADGNNYIIVREKLGYIIKQGINENTSEYIAPIRDRKYYKSYSDALKRVNLMAKEMNTIHGNDAGTSLFSEQKKYVLKTPTPVSQDVNIADDIENVPAPISGPTDASSAMPPAAAPTAEPAMDDTEMDDFGGDDMDMSEPEMSSDSGEETVSLKLIQKLTGKLAQKLRAMESAENEMTSKDIKYVINSILSALNLEELSDEDKEDILNKFEGIEAEEGMDTGEEEPSMGDEEGMETGEEEPSMEEPSSELGEDSWNESYSEENEDDDNTHIGRIADSIFMENKVEDVLAKYYRITESEKKFNKTIKKIKNSEVNLEIERLSESKLQELGAKKFLNENKNAKLIGKTNKHNLVFQFENKQIKITSEGSLQWPI
jgi:hypothetical protein